MNNVIYAYRIRETQQVVYVGQTNNLPYRRKQHEQYDIANPNNKEYNYPLSKGIRKHGLEYYECIVLEETNDLDNRERYWIAFYDTYNNGYNQTEGGQLGKYRYFTDEQIDSAINLIKNTTIPFDEISRITGISVVTLSEINHGTRRYNSQYTYPLRELTKGKKITENNLLEIKELLEHSNLPMTQIAQQYNVVVETIRKINKGKNRYHND